VEPIQIAEPGFVMATPPTENTHAVEAGLKIVPIFLGKPAETSISFVRSPIEASY
jgi:hypothetical protein